MAKLIWESAGGTFRLLDKRKDLPRPMLELECTLEGESTARWVGGNPAVHLTPEDTDELWQKLTVYLHGLDSEDYAPRDAHGILDLISKERAQLEREFADRLKKLSDALTRLDRLERGQSGPGLCPFCSHSVDPVEGHVTVDVGASEVVRAARRCSHPGCSCIVMGQPAPHQESAAAGS